MPQWLLKRPDIVVLQQLARKYWCRDWHREALFRVRFTLNLEL
jgi:hypothetical protein